MKLGIPRTTKPPQQKSMSIFLPILTVKYEKPDHQHIIINAFLKSL